MNFYRRPYLFPLFAILALVVLGAVVMLLWNAIVPALTGWALITYPKAIGLLVLCRILFGGFKGRHGCGPWTHGGMHGAWREKWSSMNEEQRAEMRARWKERCGPRWSRGMGEGPDTGSTQGTK